MSYLQKESVVETTFHVRYAETDAMGVVHHANYLVWFEEGRSALMRAHGTSYRIFEAEGLQLAVSEARVRYIAPALYDQLITVRCWIESIQSRKMRFGYEVVHAESDKRLVTGFTDHICITPDGKAARIPEKWRSLFANVAQLKNSLTINTV